MDVKFPKVGVYGNFQPWPQAPVRRSSDWSSNLVKIYPQLKMATLQEEILVTKKMVKALCYGLKTRILVVCQIFVIQNTLERLIRLPDLQQSTSRV